MDWTSHVARQKINAEATHKSFFKKNHQPFFHVFSISHQTYTTKKTIFLEIRIALSQQQHYPESTIFEDTRRISNGQPTITCDDYELTTITTRDHEADGITETI